MHRVLTHFRHDLSAQRTLCRLECGHSVLCHDDTTPHLSLGHLVRCQRCSQVSLIRLKTNWLYEVFLRDEPSEPILAVFCGYDMPRALTCWHTKRYGRIRVRFSDIAAVEMV